MNIYRVTAIIKVETDIMTSVAARPIERIVVLVIIM